MTLYISCTLHLSLSIYDGVYLLLARASPLIQNAWFFFEGRYRITIKSEERVF